MFILCHTCSFPKHTSLFRLILPNSILGQKTTFKWAKMCSSQKIKFFVVGFLTVNTYSQCLHTHIGYGDKSLLYV